MSRPGLPDPSRREPLWDRVDRNRIRLLAYVSLFVVTAVLSLDAFLLVILGTVVLLAGRGPILAPAMWLGTAVFFVLASGWAAFTLMRSEKWLLRRLHAALVPKGELLATKMALKDMALAGGLPVAPALYVLETGNVNAFVFSAQRRRAVVGVTRGLVEKLDPEEQRAVFANLIARLISGDTIVSTGVTALVWPLHAWRTGVLLAQNREMDAGFYETQKVEDAAEQNVFLPPLLIFGMAFALTAEVLVAGHRSKQLRTAEKGDAEGMLLLKEPASMLSALEKCIRLNNLVPMAGEAFADLFYCWTGVSTDDECDPEWARVSRLREVLGVEGVVDDHIDDICGDFYPRPPRLERDV